ncbi:unnamed protein product [Brassica rapa subsp. trilocularis]
MKSTEPVRVAVNIRPLKGCTDCITVTPDEPQIYHRCVAPLVEDLFKGYNATVLAYGQTASGKTYTMGMGTNFGTSDGIIPKVMEDVFTRMEAVKSQIRVSFLEIYNEEIYDLLASNPSRAPIIIRETASGEITLQGVTEVEVKTKEEMSSYLARGSFTRATGSTNMNIKSRHCRSHAVFTISLQITRAEEILCAKLRLVDLAGSERANRTGADGMRLKEGRHINSSLLALGNVISILGDERKRKKGVHIPYRVSKLTRLLQDSLGGNSKTVIIACVSPAISDVEETLNTLRYANCARNIKNKAVVQKQKTSAPSFDYDATFKELTPLKSEAKNKAVVHEHKPYVPSFDYDAMFKELTPSKSESLPVYDKPVYDKEDVFQAFSELKIPWTSQAARFDDLFASSSSRSELRKPVYDKPVYDEDVFEAITELHVFEAMPELQCDEDVFEAISELQIPSTSQPDDVSSSSPSEFTKHNTSSLDVSPKKTESEQEDKCQNKPMEIIDLIDDEAEDQEKPFIDLTTDEEAEVKEKPFIDLTTAECHLELKELNKRLEEKEAEIRGSDEEKVQLEKEKRALQREIEGLRQKLASGSSATPSCTCSKRSSCKTLSLLVFLPIIFDSSMSDENIHQDTSKAASELNKLKSLRPELAIKEMPIAINTEKPKTQHYELPTAFFELVLGRNMKYSSCYFSNDSSSLEDAEEAMLALYCQRAKVEDGQSVLDVGCGWGSLSLYIARKYSNCKITGLCNSKTQKAFIDEKCRKRGIQNIEIIVGDISTFEHEGTYDRVLSIEMFEHMKNYGELLKKIGRWMKEDALLFVHHFCHKTFAYHFEDVNDDDWITRHFFSGGTMPSANLLLYFQEDVTIVDHWLLNGNHYAKTSEEWLKRMDKEIVAIKEIMEMTYGKEEAVKWMVYWRTFFIAVAELFGYSNGEEWMVSHFLFKKK